MNKTKYTGISLMILSSFMSATGQLFWRWGHTEVIYIFIGFLCYMIGAVLMIKGMEYIPLSVAAPLMSISYILALVYGVTLFNESINIQDLFGIVFIGIGVTMTSYGKK
ncbi:DMT family transporter [Paenibacillus sp. An7]|uniref:DMT family transporter n=1 Tax=Paenibacillus sp. An7 TaxID=2689577 RepID=UPI00135B696A|nr:DMT family transporter [Paenibacillus sp. An7]